MRDYVTLPRLGIDSAGYSALNAVENLRAGRVAMQVIPSDVPI